MLKSFIPQSPKLLTVGALLAAFIVSVPNQSLFSQEATSAAAEAQPSAEAILREVRMSRALQNYPILTGKMRNDRGKVSVPIEFTMSDGTVSLNLKQPDEALLLDLGNQGTTLKRVVNGKSSVLPISSYGNTIRDTAANYEDLSMRFLYWSNPRIMGEDTVTYMKCWIVRVTNPDGRGPYGTVDIWVHKDSLAVAQMHAYNPQGKKIKVFTVRKGQKFEGAYILKQMRIEQIDPESQKVVGRTYLEIDDPK